MGGLKKKIPTDKMIEKELSKSVAFSKRRKGLYSKASQLCLLSRAQVAILVTPPCSKSYVSFYSFGHSSVDSVVSAFLANQRPRENLGSEFWWQDESLAELEDPNELSEALDSISRTLQNLKGLRSAMKKKEVVVHGTHQQLDQSQTLNLESTCASICIREDPPESFQRLVKKTKEVDQIVAVSDKDAVDRNQTLDFQSSSASLRIQDVSPKNFEGFVNKSEQTDLIVASSDSNNNGLPRILNGFNQELDFDQFFNFETSLEMDHVSTDRYPCSDSEAMLIHSTCDKEDRIVAISDKNTNNALPGHLYVCDQEVDIDQIFDLVTNSEGLSMNFEMDDVSVMSNTSQNQNWCSNSEAVEDGAVVFQRDLDQDHLQFSDVFSGLVPIGEL